MKKEATTSKFSFVLDNQQTMKNIDHLKMADYAKFKSTNELGKNIQQHAKDNQWQQIQQLTDKHIYIIPFLKLEIQDAFISALNLQNYETIKYFLQNGFSITSVADDALLTVCYSLQYLKKNQVPIELFKLLLLYGANPRASSDRNSDTPMHLAAKYNQIQFMKLLLQYGGDLNAINDKRETPLGMAIKHKREQSIVFLRQKGAEDNWKK